ncbi:MAG: hypothetical protein PHR15_08120 [Atopobiaceae bacterium]|jgi:hypothetical protein|nr:hypothetical protein [Atopobiaceae bacterium]MCH4179768.1 hypothetical protein [Atopobiaceae bacterium]MCH4213520.1 hypothetical protein [Atopobiaceae bacterium]MCH4276167.1 hypothetical protein [Atopobiaceae bacterium]MCI1227177.1 hypothetical protein [Atopobiaceae bacterium]
MAKGAFAKKAFEIGTPIVAGLASDLATEAAEKIRDPEFQKQAADAVGKAAGAVGDAAKGVGNVAKGAVEGAGQAVGAAGGFVAGAVGAQNARHQTDERRHAALAVVEGNVHVDTPTFEKNYMAAKDAGLEYFAIPGCYVIVLLGSPARHDADLERYREVYVGSDDASISEGVHRHLMGFGNVDVYADYKYRRTCQYVFMVPASGAAAIEGMRGKLTDLFGASASYNAPFVRGGDAS